MKVKLGCGERCEIGENARMTLRVPLSAMRKELGLYCMVLGNH